MHDICGIDQKSIDDGKVLGAHSWHQSDCSKTRERNPV